MSVRRCILVLPGESDIKKKKKTNLQKKLRVKIIAVPGGVVWQQQKQKRVIASSTLYCVKTIIRPKF